MTREFQPPMVIDAHAHLYFPGTVEWANLQGITRTFLMSGSTGNDGMLDFCKKSDGVYIPYCHLDFKPIADVPAACEQARRFKSMGFVGMKFQPLNQRFLPNEKRLYPLWKTLEELQMPITSHSGAVVFPGHCVNYADPSGWGEVAVDFPDLKINIAHMGGNYHFNALTIAESCPNVYLDTAYLDFFCRRMLPRVQPHEIVLMAIRYAREKVLFASEGMTPDFIYNCIDITRDDRKYIFWKNAQRLIGEPEA